MISYIYLYKEGNADNAEGENIIETYFGISAAKYRLRERVEKAYGCKLEDAPGYRDSLHVADGDQWFEVVKMPIRRLPKDVFDVVEIGKYNLNFLGLNYDNNDNSRPYGNLSITAFDDAGRPLNNGEPLRHYYISYGGPECVIGATETQIDALLEDRPDNAKLDLCDLMA